MAMQLVNEARTIREHEVVAVAPATTAITPTCLALNPVMSRISMSLGVVVA